MGADSRPSAAEPLDPNSSDLPHNVQEVLDKGRNSWLKSTEVFDLLLHYATYNLRVEKEPPCQPPGSLALTDTGQLSQLGSQAWCSLLAVSADIANATCTAGGSVFLFDRKAVRFFRKDNHNWRKKADGKTVRETHEKLKVRLHCHQLTLLSN